MSHASGGSLGRRPNCTARGVAWRHVRRAFLILLLFAVLVALALLLAQDQDTLHIRSAVPAEDPRHPAYISALLGADLQRGNTYDVLTNGDQIFPSMIEAIHGATRRISFESYIFDSGQIAEQFTAAFEAAARRGVRVQIVVDSVGASSMEAAHVERLRRAGCHVAEFNRPRWYSLEELNYRTHRKIMVVDGDVGFTGGVGPDACIDAVGTEAHIPGPLYAYDRFKQALMLETDRAFALRPRRRLAT